MLVIAFDSTHAALAAQDLLSALRVQLIPTPRSITSDCGMSLRVDPDDGEAALTLLKSRPDIYSLCALHRMSD